MVKETLKTIALEGPSFSGKTTLVNYCRGRDSLVVIPEYYEMNDKLSLAGPEPIRDELGQKETFFKLMRIECQRQRMIKESMLKKQKIIQDRSWFSLISYEFSRYYFRDTWKKLKEMVMLCDFMIPQIILYIDTSPDLVQKRGTCNGIGIDHIILKRDFIERNKKFFIEFVSDYTEVRLCTYVEANKFIRRWSSET